MILACIVDLAAEGHEKLLLEVLRASPPAARLEPLVVALARVSGEEPRAPHEVDEVAKDIIKRIEELRGRPRAP